MPSLSHLPNPSMFSDRVARTKSGTIAPRWPWSDWYRKEAHAHINALSRTTRTKEGRELAYYDWLISQKGHRVVECPGSVDPDWVAPETPNYRALLQSLIAATKQDDVTALERAWNAANQALAA